jgi:CHAT domain-containing protein
MDRSEVLHFDGHGITNSQYPERGGLLLAPADPAAPDIASSLLTAADLPPRALKHLRLVILGACSTGLTSYQDTAEVTGLAAAFLARGVPAVIGTAWDVPDEGASRLLEQLHRELAEGERPEKALQEAQRVILHSNLGEADTRTWAAFQVFLHGKHGTRSVYVQ